MKHLNVETKSNIYPIYITDSFDYLRKAFIDKSLDGNKAVLIADSTTGPLYADKVKGLIEDCFSDISVYTFEAGEKSKNLDTINSMYRFFINSKLDRKSIVIALGGGVTGDMAGFAAATFMRGIKFVQIPTTLLAQVDSSVGGKVGVDFEGNKNMIGAFYQPQFVYINAKTLDTLPKTELSAGLSEAVKHGYIYDYDYLRFMFSNKEKIFSLDIESITDVIYGSCKVKSNVVSKDEKESGLREILNFGHTFGHAIESLSGFKLVHGQCVSIGMTAALYLSYKRGCIKENELNLAKNLLEYFELPVKVSGFNTKDIYKQMLFDKKNKNNKINLVLLNDIGNAYTERNASEEEIKNAIEFILN